MCFSYYPVKIKVILGEIAACLMILLVDTIYM